MIHVEEQLFTFSGDNLDLGDVDVLAALPAPLDARVGLAARGALQEDVLPDKAGRLARGDLVEFGQF